MQEFPITQAIMTKNDCYTKYHNEKCAKKYVWVHSTASKGTSYLGRWYKWDVPGHSKCAHFFLDWNGIYQNLPLDQRCWLNGVTSGNTNGIGFEICEPAVVNDTPTMANMLYCKTLFLCVDLCRKYNIPSENVLCHAEAYKKGFANNHGDVNHWWGKRGTSWEPYTMSRLRLDIAKELGEIVVPKIKETREVKTKSGNGIGIYSDVSKTTKKIGVADGERVDIFDVPMQNNFFNVQKGAVMGWADSQYLVNPIPVDAPPTPVVTGKYGIWIPCVEDNEGFAQKILPMYGAGAKILQQ